jgi:hypothetical protein
MIANNLTPKEYLENLINNKQCYDLDNGKVALYHKDIEHMAAYFDVSVDVDIKTADGKIRFAICKAIAKVNSNNRVYASLGEAHPDNNGFEYFVAVAEKRAVDRAILKALQLHGDVLSFEELDLRNKSKKQTIKKTTEQPKNEKPKVKTITEEIEQKILSSKDKLSFSKNLGKYANFLEQLLKENPGCANELLEKIQVKQQEMEDK